MRNTLATTVETKQNHKLPHTILTRHTTSVTYFETTHQPTDSRFKINKVVTSDVWTSSVLTVEGFSPAGDEHVHSDVDPRVVAHQADRLDVVWKQDLMISIIINIIYSIYKTIVIRSLGKYETLILLPPESCIVAVVHFVTQEVRAA